LAAIYRRKQAEERAQIEQKVEERKQAVLQHYESQKHLPIQQKQKELKTIDGLLVPIDQTLENTRTLTLQRLSQLPDVPADAEADLIALPKINTVVESFEALQRFAQGAQELFSQMQRGVASGVVLWLILPAAVLVFTALWSVIAYLFAPDPPWLVMGTGIPIGGVLGFIAYLILQRPLNRMTRELYPQVEQISRLAHTCADSGKRISVRIASDTSAELIQRRDAHLEAAQKWRVDSMAEMEQRLAREQFEARNKLEIESNAIEERFLSESTAKNEELRRRADEVANVITQRLSDHDQYLKDQREAGSAARLAQRQRLHQRLRHGLERGFRRVARSFENVNQRFPRWDSSQPGEHPTSETVDFLPVGHARLANFIHDVCDATAAFRGSSGGFPEYYPVVLHRRKHAGLIVTCAPNQLKSAVEAVHQLLWRLLCSAPAARAKLTLIDSIGRGQHFTSFMALADHDPSIVNHRVWTTESRIESRLSELAHHVEDILQSCLRDRFERIEDYNQMAGSMAEPYRAIAAVGLPEGLSRDGYKHLRALLESGNRCGIITLMVCEESRPWPSDMPLPVQNRLLKLRVDAAGQWKLDYPGFESSEFIPLDSPPNALRESLADVLGKRALAASRVEIPLETILAENKFGQATTASGIEIPIGTQGANRQLCLELGEGVRQHVLIAGKTGSGKSTLLHAIITAGLFQYLPSQLHYYLLDFKKGVEFKVYADSGIPHFRVIGIESEREFGRSILQRLDSELQQRGEWFRAESVQELQAYCRKTGRELPRILLVVDEFQELFLRDDALASDCAMLLDRLVRQGRSFGIHVILSSQSLAGAYSLPRATLGQMAVRIAMQCSESDAALILADDNTAARLLSRPGEAIYNDASGLSEGNQPFQVAWLASESSDRLLQRIASRDVDLANRYAPTVIFEGNRPARWTAALAQSVTGSVNRGGTLRGLLGEAVEIGPPVVLELPREPGRNALVVSSGEKKNGIIASLVTSFAKESSSLRVVYFDGTRADDAPSLISWFTEAGIAIDAVKPRDAEITLTELVQLIQSRSEHEEDYPPVIVVIDPLDRFRDLRQDDSFSFSLDSAAKTSPAASLQTLLRDGPAVRVFTLLVCNTVETLSRWLPRASQHDLQLRILGVLNANDSSMLIDSPAAAQLSAATMLLYDDADGRLIKFRYIHPPAPDAVRNWIDVASNQAN
jgi:S-DNA-T family DNA segregation ATPase FtsK/SpoIIIE